MARHAAAQGFRPPEGESTPQPTPLTAYLGRYPSQQIDGVLFYDRTDVHSAVTDNVADPTIRQLVTSSGATRTPIFAGGTRVASWGCEPNNCAAHNWTVFVDPRGGAGAVCYHDASDMGDRSRWYSDGKRAMRPGACPSEQQMRG